MFFTPRLILVEGLEDQAYITAYLHFLDLWDEYRRYGCHIVPVGLKSSMIQAIAIAKGLSIPTFVVFDSDGEKPDKHGSRTKHERDNKAILNLCSVPSPNPFPGTTFWRESVVMWSSDIGSVVAADIGEDHWKRYSEESDKMYGHVGNMQKNMLHIGTTLSLAWDDGKRSPSLERLCKGLLEFGKLQEAL